MNRLVLVAVLAGGSFAWGIETTVTLDVVAGDPNDPNRLIVAEGGQAITYHIVALVESNDPNDPNNPDVSNGLGAAYVTLNSDFGDANALAPPGQIEDPLDDLYASTGLALGDDITDIGGSQPLVGEDTPIALAAGETAVIASGTLTVPYGLADGWYHVWVTPQQVSVLDPNLSDVPTGLPPDEVVTGQGFYVVIGEYDYYTLTLYINNQSYGDVSIVPDLPGYPDGMPVTLTAIPVEGRSFEEWRHYDPNDPYDANYVSDPNYYVADANNPITVVMDQDRIIGAVFDCGSSMGPILPMLAIGLLGTGWAVRRMQLHS